MATKKDIQEVPPRTAVRTASRTDIITPEKARRAITLPPAKPADPIEHFRNTQCEEGHMNWDPDSLKYSIDHRAFLIRCIDCNEYSAIPAGGVQPIEMPAGSVPPGGH